MNTAEVNIKVENSYRNIIQLALPMMVAILIPQISMIVNTIFLGTYNGYSITSQDMLAVMAVAGIYFLTLLMIGYGFSNGLLMLMSRAAGENDSKKLGKVFSNGVLVGLFIACILMLLSWFVAPLLFNHMIHDSNIRMLAIAFIKIRIWGLPFIIISQIGNQLFIATSTSKRIMLGTLVHACVNIILDYTLIFGNFGFAELGIMGAAYASVIAEVFYFVIIFLQIYFVRFFKQFNIRYLTSLQWSIMKESIIKSSPLMLQNFLSIAAWEVFMLYVEHSGKLNVAISQLLRSVFGLVGIATWAMGSTCNSMVSNLIGQHKYDEVLQLIKKIVVVSFSCAFILGVCMLCFPSQFLHVLTNDTAIIANGVAPLRIVVAAIWMLSVSIVLFSAVLGTGNTRVNLLFEVVAIALYLVYIHIVIEKLHLSLCYAWASEFVYWSILLCLSAWYLHRGSWRKVNTV